MKTRNNGLCKIGFYRPFFKPPIPKSCKNIKKRKKIKATSSFDSLYFTEQLMYTILKQLKPSKSLLMCGKIILSKGLIDMLKKKYKLNFRYKNLISLLDDLNISKIRYVNDVDYCEIVQFDVKFINQANSIFSTKFMDQQPFFVTDT